MLPNEVLVDGERDRRYPGIQYWGKATRQPDGTYRCLANVEGSLCVVEVNIKPMDVGDGECRA
jgi:hypothetical protein